MSCSLCYQLSPRCKCVQSIQKTQVLLGKKMCWKAHCSHSFEILVVVEATLWTFVEMCLVFLMDLNDCFQLFAAEAIVFFQPPCTGGHLQGMEYSPLASFEEMYISIDDWDLMHSSVDV